MRQIWVSFFVYMFILRQAWNFVVSSQAYFKNEIPFSKNFFGVPKLTVEVRWVILISGQNQNCPFLKTDSLADTFFWTKIFLNNVKCYGEKVLEIFLTLKKFFFQDTFFEKKVKKNFEKLFALKKFSKFFLNFFSKKASWKKICECQKHFQNFSPIILYICFKFFGKKKSSA